MNPELSIGDEITHENINLSAGESYEVSGNEIITVVVGEVSVKVSGIVSDDFPLNKFESTSLEKGQIKALKDTILSVFSLKNEEILTNSINVDESFGDYCRANWSQLRELYDVEGFEKVDLYRGDQISFSDSEKDYKINLWFCGAGVDCLWHNEHNFVEIHTCIAGNGYMQKSSDGTDEGKYEEVCLLPGDSHKPFCLEGQFTDEGNPVYPYHRWLGGATGNIWLAVEEYKKTT